ncbi:MAG: replication-associated recombination protein A, partial [Pseudomonadota bacterium]
ASSAKSNRSYKALRSSQAFIKDHGQLPPPADIVSQASYANSKTYKSPHNTDQGYIARSHLPQEIQHQKFYEPSEFGEEKQIKQRLRELDPKKYQDS